MSDQQALKKVVAELFNVEPDAIDASFSLRHPRLQGSAGRGVLAAAIRRELGVYCPKVFTAMYYGELASALFGSGGPDAPASGAPAERRGAPPSAPGPQGESAARIPGVRVGVDVEMVENMPDVPDFWTAPFYQAHFTPAEIAYCLRQEQPRIHFAARWCAKEALGKCDRSFAGVDPTTIQIIPQADGQPVLEVLNGTEAKAIDFAVSLSHTPVLAIAVVATGRAQT